VSNKGELLATTREGSLLCEGSTKSKTKKGGWEKGEEVVYGMGFLGRKEERELLRSGA